LGGFACKAENRELFLISLLPGLPFLIVLQQFRSLLACKLARIRRGTWSEPRIRFERNSDLAVLTRHDSDLCELDAKNDSRDRVSGFMVCDDRGTHRIDRGAHCLANSFGWTLSCPARPIRASYSLLAMVHTEVHNSDA
jgi:hypothetical protein